jgi:hypothetical protein
MQGYEPTREAAMAAFAKRAGGARAKACVRFAPESGRNSGHRRMSQMCQLRTYAVQQTIQKATWAIDPSLRDTDLFHHRPPQLLFPADEFGRLSR